MSKNTDPLVSAKALVAERVLALAGPVVVQAARVQAVQVDLTEVAQVVVQVHSPVPGQGDEQPAQYDERQKASPYPEPGQSSLWSLASPHPKYLLKLRPKGASLFDLNSFYSASRVQNSGQNNDHFNRILQALKLAFLAREIAEQTNNRKKIDRKNEPIVTNNLCIK